MTTTANSLLARNDHHAGAVAKERNGAIDTMRGMAIVMVIIIHSLPRSNHSAVLTGLDAIFRPCVAIFLFASGYLSAKAASVPLAKRIGRALVPYTVAFGAAYLFMALNNPQMDHRLYVAVARYLLGYVFVYYYVFVYIGCTLLLWLSFVVANNDGKRRQNRVVVLLCGAVIVGLTAGAYLDPLLQRAGVPEQFIEEIRMRDILFWFAFSAIGAIVGIMQAQNILREWRWPLAACTSIAYAIYAAIRVKGIGDAADYDSTAYFLYAAFLCVTLLGFSWQLDVIADLGSVSYFIYLWHIFVIMTLRGVPALQDHAGASFLIEFSAALGISGMFVMAIRRFVPPRVAQWLGA